MNRREYLLPVLALASASMYVLLASTRGALGFALDDAWIHQVYARNLAAYGEFSFFRGQVSAGSTSPLWTLVLALGYILRIDYRFWAYFAGALLVGASAVIMARLSSRLMAGHSNDHPLVPLASALFVVLEWHLAWSAVSGMEIPLFVFLSLLLLERFYAHAQGWMLGILAGLLVLARPEGIVLASLVAVGIVWRAFRPDEGDSADPMPAPDLKPRILSSFRSVAGYGIGLVVLLIPYVLFNLAASGTPLPNTFYAKNAEYAFLFEGTPFWLRWLELIVVSWKEGAQILLLPGLVLIAARLLVQRRWLALLPLVWLLVLPGLYALRLPVAYQHGRYEMPVIPIIVLYGVWGTAALIQRIRNRVVRRTWAMATAALLVAFWFLGADAYGKDVAIIDCEMVQSAQWIASNAPTGSLVAAHDIGALGYFYPHSIIDLAGLVTPEIIPLMRDESRLRDYLLSRRATLAVFFPDWYPTLAADPRFAPVQRQDCPIAREGSETDMVIYQLH